MRINGRVLCMSALVICTSVLGASVLGVTALDAKTAEADATVQSLDGLVTLRSEIVGGRTIVTRVPGREVVLRVDEPLQLRVVEPGGHRVVLGNPLPPGGDPYQPGGRESTHLVVADLDTADTRSYDIPRNVEPEAFGVGIDQLFVVDHRPAGAPTYYRVGAINLVNGEFGGLLGPNKQPLDLDMSGTARRQILSASGNQLYTLYVEHAHDDGGDGDARSEITGAAFVHVLDLAGAWAYCVDLPGIGHGPENSNALRLSPDGKRLVVTDRHLGTRLTILTSELDLAHLVGSQPLVTARRLAG